MKRQFTQQHKDRLSKNKKKWWKNNKGSICGQKHPLYGKKHSKKSKLKMSISLKGNNSPAWTGGRHITSDGYMAVWTSNHPYKNIRNYVYEHRLIIEKYLGHYLKRIEVVHHINKNKLDNRIKNLIVFNNSPNHLLCHRNKNSRKGIIFDGRLQNVI